MDSKIPEELISAYIDGELTDDERALVEQALREDPQSRQLLADLQLLHDYLRSAAARLRSESDYDMRQLSKKIMIEQSYHCPFCKRVQTNYGMCQPCGAIMQIQLLVCKRPRNNLITKILVISGLVALAAIALFLLRGML
jgi:uncharacterized membrane protein YebE (DUF533 family)